MFMYAAGRALAERTGGQLLLNTTAFSRDYRYKRILLLDRFPVSATFLPDTWPSRALDFIDSVAAVHPWLVPGLTVVHEPSHGGTAAFSDQLERLPSGQSISLRGYWQDERYFGDCARVIRRELTPPVPRDSSVVGHLLRIKDSPHPVAIGIRFYGEVPEQSSNPGEIISVFRRTLVDHAIKVPGCDYFVFTDEPHYFHDTNSLGVRVTVLPHAMRNEDAPVHLHLMAQCRSFFIGYSSFHWWGAWLSNQLGKSVAYLRFPVHRGAEYAAAGWNVIEVC